MRTNSLRRTSPVVRVERALEQAPAGLLAAGAMLFTGVAAFAVVLLRAH